MKTVLGLKASPSMLSDDSEESSDFFSSDSDDDGNFPLQPLGSNPPRLSPLVPTVENLEAPSFMPTPAENQISSFDAASLRITQILNSLEDYVIPPPFKGNLYFVPENAVSEDFSAALNDFVTTKSTKVLSDMLADVDVADTVLAQIELLRYLEDPTRDLSELSKKDLDSRVKTLIHWVLSHDENLKVSLFHVIHAAEEFVKSPDVAPISSLFEDFSFVAVVHKICVDLVLLFPRHPILPSVLHKFERYDPRASEVLSLAPEDEDSDDSDFDDSFFETIHAMQQQAPLISLTLASAHVSNPLENCQPSAGNVVKITVAEPPKTVTYKLPDGSEHWGPNQFADWVASITQKNVVVRTPSSVFNVKDKVTMSDPPVANNNSDLLEASEVTVETFTDMLQNLGDQQRLLSTFPSTVPPSLFGASLPVLQVLNINAVTPIRKGCLYPKLIKEEFDGHNAVKDDDQEKALSVLSNLMQLVGSDVKTAQIAPLPEKRDLPSLEDTDTTDIVAALALCDVEFILNGRSPLSLMKIGNGPGDSIGMTKDVRREALYHFYAHHNFSAYISFRLAFALALNLAEMRPALACDFIFEGVYCLLQTTPEIAQLDCARAALLFFGILLEKIDKYYYAALLFDTYFLINTADVSNSNTIAQIAQRRRDMARAVFHYKQSMKALAEEGRADSAVYVSHIIVSILTEFGLQKDAFRLLTNLLSSTYKLPVGNRRVKMIQPQGGNRTMPPVRPSSGNKETAPLQPTASAVNTILAGIALADLLVKNKYFKIASLLIEQLKKTTDNGTFIRLTEFIQAKMYLKQNKFKKFLKNIPKLNLRNKRGVTGGKLTIFGASSFDPSMAAVRRIIKGYLERDMFRNAVFWSEVLILSTRTTLKDLGKAHYLRGIALLTGCEHTCHSSEISLELPLDELMSSVAKYAQHITYTSAELRAEALASLRTARLCFDTVGCYRRTLESSLLYFDVVLCHFFGNDEGDKIEPLKVKLPRVNVSIPGPAGNLSVPFEEYTISSANVEEHLATMCSSIEQASNKLMDPMLILAAQVMFAKYQLLKSNTNKAQSYLDFAFTNLKRYFMCAGLLIPRDLNILTIRELQRIVRNLCHCLLHFDKDFINDRLIAFDWLSDIDDLIANRLRNVETENMEPIDAGAVSSMTTYRRLMNCQFPDFTKTLRDGQALEIEEAPNSGLPEESISTQLSLIIANAKLAESQKLSDDEMHERNRALCRQIESLAESNRRINAATIPVDTKYQYLMRTRPMAGNIIFLQHLYKSIYVYVPSSGVVKRVPLKTESQSTPITFTANRAQVSYASNSSLFKPEFFSLLSLFTLCDKKQKHSSFNRKSAQAILSQAKQDVFGDIGNDFCELPVVRDDREIGDKGFFAKSVKGSLYTIKTSEEPITFVTSSDLRCMPLELMFPKQQVLRCSGLVQLMLKPTTQIPYPRMTVCRWKGEASHLMESAVKRSCEEIHRFIYTCGGCDEFIPYVDELERSVCFPYPLFSSNQDNSYYRGKYKFCDFVDVQPNVVPDKVAALFMFTYSDFCEMPLMLERMIREHPFAFYMFIPAQFVRDAFREMIPIFERQQKRISFVNGCTKNGEVPDWVAQHACMLIPYDFCTCLQTTLIQRLGCPIALIAPSQ